MTDYEKKNHLVGYADFPLDTVMRIFALAQQIFYSTDKECEIHIGQCCDRSVRFIHVSLIPKSKPEDISEDDLMDIDYFLLYANEIGRTRDCIKKMEGWLNEYGTMAY